MIIAPSVVAKYWFCILSAFIVLLFVSVILALSFGAVPVSFPTVLKAMLGHSDAQTQLILFDIRLPRALLALCVGAMLAGCGAVTQGLFRNPLADPSLIGVGAGAAVGASLVIVFFNTVNGAFWGLSAVSLGAFLGGIICVVFVYRLSTGPSGTSVATMLLAGIAVTFLAGSFSSLLEFLADNEMLRRISLWRMGGLETASYTQVSIAAFTLCTLALILPRYTTALNVFLLGESEARHLGIQVNTVKKIMIVCVAAGVGVCVALAGTIVFVGLIIPHIIRLLIGPDHRYLLPLSAVCGATLLVLADTLSRVIIEPTELPIGIVTTFLGAPVFISLLRRRHQYGMQAS